MWTCQSLLNLKKRKKITQSLKKFKGVLDDGGYDLMLDVVPSSSLLVIMRTEMCILKDFHQEKCGEKYDGLFYLIKG